MKKLLSILFLFFSLTASSQCVSNQSFILSSPGPYSPGDVVAVDYTLGTFTQLNINWIIAFQINLGAGWTNLMPLIAPVGGGTQPGGWVWDVQNTYPSGLRFRVTVGPTCTPDNLLISMNVIGDCLTGGWNNGACCTDPAYQIYNGNVQIVLPTTSNINHY
jgi:hypothetical protein